MKAVIVELRGAYAAALSDDGCIRQLKNKNYTVGQEIELVAMRRPALRIASIAAVIAAIALPSYAYYTPYSYVSLDTVTSIEYSLNRFNRVLGCTAVNGEGSEILEQLTLKNKKIDEAIQLTVNAIAKGGYFTSAESDDIVITASSKNKEESDRLAEALADTAAASVQEESLTVEVSAEGVGRSRVEDAKALGITPGKLNLIEELKQSSNPETPVEFEDWLDKPVKEIIRQTKENKENKKAESDKGDNSSKEQKPNQGQNNDKKSNNGNSDNGNNNPDNGNGNSKNH
ncbi:hypothetical protein MASR2M70_22280 [Bacillota bacterium]